MHSPLDHSQFGPAAQKLFNGLDFDGCDSEIQPPPPDDAVPDGFTADGLEIAKPVPQLVKGILPQRGSALLNGQSGAGKTFIATDLAVAFASGQDFFGKHVKRRGGVVIIAAEGMGGLQNRLIAAKMNRCLSKALPILWPLTTGNLLNGRDLQATLDKLTQAHLYFQRKFGVPLVLTIIDTITKACGMKDENANAEIVKVCKDVLDRNRHSHAGAYSRRASHGQRSRCWSARWLRMDRQRRYRARHRCRPRSKTGECTNRTLALAKNCDGIEGPLGGFKLKFIELGTDDDGEPFGSCAIEQTGERERPAPARREGHGAKAFHDAFNEIMVVAGDIERRPNGNGPKVHAVRLLAVRDEFYRRYPASEDDPTKAYDARRKAWKKTLGSMLENRRYFHETERGVEWLWQ